MKFNNEINDGYSLGKGEVVSSILPGSTRKPHEIRSFLTAPKTTSDIS